MINDKEDREEKLAIGEILDEIRLRLLNSSSKSSKSSKRNEFTDFSPEELLEQLNTYVTKALYEDDDRKDLYTILDNNIQSLADGVVSLIRNDLISSNGNDTSTILTQPFSSRYRLCDGGRFASQPTAPFCSGFLVAPDIIATAGHCIDGRSDLPTINFVFGFRMLNISSAEVVIPNKDIYYGIEIIKRKYERSGNLDDYALIRLDRPVTDHRVLNVRREGKIADGAKLFVLGHPSGLPLKYADNAEVNQNLRSNFFEATLDTFAGNSGSPVFNQDTNEVEGILVRGENDYTYDIARSCYTLDVYDANDRKGEDVQRSTTFSSFIDNSVTKRLVSNSGLDISEKVESLESMISSIAKDIKEIKDSL